MRGGNARRTVANRGREVLFRRAAEMLLDHRTATLPGGTESLPQLSETSLPLSAFCCRRALALTVGANLHVRHFATGCHWLPLLASSASAMSLKVTLNINRSAMSASAQRRRPRGMRVRFLLKRLSRTEHPKQGDSDVSDRDFLGRSPRERHTGRSSKYRGASSLWGSAAMSEPGLGVDRRRGFRLRSALRSHVVQRHVGRLCSQRR